MVDDPPQGRWVSQGLNPSYELRMRGRKKGRTAEKYDKLAPLIGSSRGVAMGRRIAGGLICLCLLPSLAQAQADHCTTETLQGRYVFTGRGFIEPGELAIQRVHYGIFVFDGTGKFSGKQSSSRDGKIGREKLQGAYTLDSDCTGTMTFESVGLRRHVSKVPQADIGT